jgi:hypothetical protein
MTSMTHRETGFFYKPAEPPVSGTGHTRLKNFLEGASPCQRSRASDTASAISLCRWHNSTDCCARPCSKACAMISHVAEATMTLDTCRPYATGARAVGGEVFFDGNTGP